jgi:short-subunit dehydrogenase
MKLIERARGLARRNHPLKNKVVVITGASSGLGRETALQLAERGCRLVLAARRDDALEEVAEHCRNRGGEALVVPADVTSEESLDQLIRSTLEQWGTIDVWINNAGVTTFAHLDQGEFAEHRRVIETNLFGAMLGARLVLPVFRRQRHGTLINVSSVLGKIGQPFAPSYAISKFGLRGLSEVLRVEVADELGIHVCTVLPYAIDTPHFQVGANEIERETFAMPPMQSPEKVACAIVGLIVRPRREILVPRSLALGLALHWLMPRPIERLLLHALRNFHLGGTQPRTEGAVFEPPREKAAIHGRRPPKLGAGELLAWAARELVRIEVDTARQRVERWRSVHATP